MEFILDADYQIRKFDRPGRGCKTIWRCPIYEKWLYMRDRLNPNKIKINPAYRNVTIDPEWYVYSNFYKWVKSLNIPDCDIKNLQLDKDLKTGGNVYSSTCCLMVPTYVNNIIIARESCRGKFPLGVTYEPTHKTKKFKSYVSTFKSKCENLGRFDNEIDAHRSFQLGKIKHINEIILKYKFESFYYKDVEDTLNMIISKIQNDYDNCIETTKYH